jgi:DNA-binding CsgD family transcriptional regulator/GAF domain-containing protein
LSARGRQQVAGVLEAVHAAINMDPDGPGLARPDQVDDLPSARAALAAAWERVLGAVDAVVSGNGPAWGGPPAGLVALLGEIKQAEELLTTERLRHRDESFGRVRDALGQLRDCDSTAALVERAASAVCAVGFDRAIVSRIEDSAWIPERVWVERDHKWADEILEIGRAHPQVLDRTLVETEMVRRKVGILVHDVQLRPAVHRPIADASQSRSYAAVPLISDGTVVGFVHCDCYYQQRNLDDFDRQLLTLFAEGLGQALGRTAMLDRLSSVRAGFDQVAATLSAAWGERARLGVVAPAPLGGQFAAGFTAGFPGGSVGAGAADRFPTSAGEGSSLTRREIEVLRLMAAGDTNGRIARRLVISEGTVKSHVKHILRKLGAANRAEAVSRWLGMEHERGSGRNGIAGGSFRRDN